MTIGWIIADEVGELVAALFAYSGLRDTHAKVGREVDPLLSRHLA